MRSLIGMLLLGAGIGIAAVWLPANDSEGQLAVVTEVATRGVAQVRVPQTTEPAPQPRIFSPLAPLLREAVAASDGRRQELVDRDRDAQLSGFASAPSAVMRPAKRAQTPIENTDVAPDAGLPRSRVVTIERPDITGTVVVSRPEVISAPQIGEPSPRSDLNRAELVRKLQRELKRVGCYHGDIDGTWGQGSKHAMSSFIERVNATLPIDEPDYILLTLVRGQTAQACGKGCPSGQVATENGKCAAPAVVAQLPRRGADDRSTEWLAIEDHVAKAAVTERTHSTASVAAPDLKGRAAGERSPVARSSSSSPPANETIVAALETTAGAVMSPSRIPEPAPPHDTLVTKSPEATPAAAAVRASLSPASSRGDRAERKPHRAARSYAAQRVITHEYRYRAAAPSFAPVHRVFASRGNWTAHFFDRF